MRATSCSISPSRKRQDHPHPLAVAHVRIAVERDEIALLEPDADEDVSGGGDREQEMPQRHRRRRPEREQEAEGDRMPHVLVEQRRAEAYRLHGPALATRTDLPPAEQIEMIAQERAGQQDAPTDAQKLPKERAATRVAARHTHSRDS